MPRIVTPQEANVRSAVHEYGGGAYTPFIYKNEPSILFTDFKGSTNSLCLCKENKGSDPIQIYPPASTTTTAGSTKTPTSDESRNAPAPLRFADFEYDPIHNCIVCVCEDHTNASKASMVQNSIVSINLECDDNSGSLSGEGKKMKITTLACGNDFYSAPKLSPDGKQLAYVTWNHPNMPWDCTELCVQEVSSDDGEVGDGNCGIISRGTSRSVHGDVKKTLDSGGVSAAEPRWGVTTTNLDSDHKEHERHSLFFLSDASGWYNLYSALPTTEKALFTSTSVIEREADFSDSAQG